MTPRLCLSLAAVFGFLAVLMGAFGAHGLAESRTGQSYLERKYADTEAKNVAGMTQPASYKYLQDFKTGVRYHMWHTLALLATGLLMLHKRSRLLSAAGWCFVGGIVFFSGALYILVILGPKFGGITWGLVAPIGGTLQLFGWILLFLACLKISPRSEPSATPPA